MLLPRHVFSHNILPYLLPIIHTTCLLPRDVMAHEDLRSQPLQRNRYARSTAPVRRARPHALRRPLDRRRVRARAVVRRRDGYSFVVTTPHPYAPATSSRCDRRVRARVVVRRRPPPGRGRVRRVPRRRAALLDRRARGLADHHAVDEETTPLARRDDATTRARVERGSNGSEGERGGAPSERTFAPRALGARAHGAGGAGRRRA